MRQIFAISIIMLLFCNFSNAQNVYENYTQNDTIRGEQLWIGASNLRYERTVSTYTSFNINLNGSYSKWKFTPKNLYYLQAHLSEQYSKYSSNDPAYPNGRRNSFFSNVYAGVSHYLKPKEFYGNISTKLSLYTSNSDIDNSYTLGNGYLFGALGYGRINNAQGLEAAIYFSEALLKTKVISKPLDKNTLLAIDKIIYSFRNGNYVNDYKDDAEIYLMKDIEKVLMEYSAISERLDAESTMRLFSIFSNRSQKYSFYTQYIGFQAQAEVQYHLFSDIKPKENFAKVSAAYGLSLSKNSSLLLNGFYARALGDEAGNSLQQFPIYYMLPYGESDVNNFNFTNNDFGRGTQYNSIIPVNKSIIGFDSYLTHSLSSTAGIFFRTSYHLYPKDSDALLPSESKFLFNSSIGLDYNIYSKLFANLHLGYYKNEVHNQESYMAGVNFSYIIF